MKINSNREVRSEKPGVRSLFPGVLPSNFCLLSPRRERGIALVITLIMLAVTLVMAVAFLALSRRERGSVTTTTDTTTARLAAEQAVANAEAQIVAGMLTSFTNGNSSNAYNLHLLVSTNYINPNGFTNNVANPDNVSYFDQYGNLLTGGSFEQMVANLFYLPRAPVLISSNELLGRFYLDLNENRRYDANGWVPNMQFVNGSLITNGYVNVVGDPEWVGVLEHPDAPHSANNHFLSRWAFIALPVGNSLDLNYIHNQVLDEKNANATVNANSADTFFRNQGVGSWEINLAAFLADLNTNIWSPVALPAYLYYAYNEPGSPNSGYAFEDARALLAYRYNYNYNSQANATTVFNDARNNALDTFRGDGIDGYSDGPLQTTLNTNEDWIPDDPSRPWPGANNTNHFFSISDFLNPTLNLGQFTNRLRNAGAGADTYDRYTYYRMLDELGTDSSPDEGKVNLNYSNAVVTYNRVGAVTSIGVVAGAETNLVPWTPQDFFNAAADRLLRTYTTNWFQSNPSNFLATYYGVIPRGYSMNASGAGVPNGQYFTTNQIPAFGITNIPVLVSNRFVYTPAVNRLLQLAANLYDATTMTNNNLPHVFRPVFNIVPNNQNPRILDVFICGYTNIMSVLPPPLNFEPYQLPPNNPFSQPLSLPGDLRGIAGPLPLGRSLQVEANIYGVPWIIGAKKGLPNFNQLYLLNEAQVTRKLMVSRPSLGAALRLYTTNQMYVIGISNSLGVSFWNSYIKDYPRPVNVYTFDRVFMTLTNGAATWQGFTNFHYGARINVWPGSQWSGGTPPNVQPSPNSFFNLNWSFNFLNPSVYRFSTASLEPVGSLNAIGFETTTPPLPQLPQFGLQMTNFLQAFIMDGDNVIDYVQLSDPVSGGGLNQALADPNYPDQSQIHYQWSTNYYANQPPTPYGVINQLTVSANSALAPASGGKWSSAVTPMGLTTPPAEAAYYEGFFVPSFQMPGDPKIYVNSQLKVQAPYTPSRTVFSSFLLQANDPLVHYLASDLNSQNGALAIWASKQMWRNGLWYHSDDPGSQPLPQPPANPIGGRYQPWGQNSQMKALASVDTNAYNLAYKDPLIWGSDSWNFPTNPYPTVGWIGRVHRGTPWQTVDLKSTNILSFAMLAGKQGFLNVGSNTWANWTGDLQQDYYTGQFIEAANSSPMQDRLLFDVFTTRFNDNAVRGTLPVNQTHLAAWSALFSGMVVLSNNAAGAALTPSLLSWPRTIFTNLSPVGVMNDALPYWQQPPIWQIVNGPYGINATRTNINMFPFQAFLHAGDVLQTPALSDDSPFLNRAGFQMQEGISDELYEWLPQQMMGLVRLGEPRYVVYAYGQTLKPAPGGEVLSGPFFQLITNYQVMAESAVRAVIRVDNANTAKPHAVVESYNVLPPN